MIGRHTNTSSFYLAKGLTEEEFDQLSAMCFSKTFADGEVLFREGDEGRDLFILINGVIRIDKKDDAGESKFVRNVDEQRSILGEISFVLNKGRTATGTAVGVVDVIIFPHAEYERLVKTNDPLGLKLGYNVLLALADRQEQWNYGLLNLVAKTKKQDNDDEPNLTDHPLI